MLMGMMGRWDYATSVKEVMDSLHTLVQQRKVLYLGISDTAAWIVSQANEYAKAYGKTPFSIYQGAWSVLQRFVPFPLCILPVLTLESKVTWKEKSFLWHELMEWRLLPSVAAFTSLSTFFLKLSFSGMCLRLVDSAALRK